MGLPARREELATIGEVHVRAMREHDRRAALLHWGDARWEETPDWRLDRQVIRLGLYLKERAGLKPGDRAAIVSPLRREWLLADLSVALQGASAVAVDPDLPPAALAQALDLIAPRVIFASGPAAPACLGAVANGSPSPERVIAFDGPAAPEGAALLAEVLDLGGTLDTAERAVAFRARARELSPEAPALEHVRSAADGSLVLESMSHRQALAGLEALWSAEPSRSGDLAYVAGRAMAPGLRLALLAFVGDGVTTVAFGTPGREVEELSELRPHRIVAPPALLDAAVARGPTLLRDGRGWARAWLEQAAQLVPLARERVEREGIRSALGGRARWLRATSALPATLSRRMRGALAIDEDV